MKSDIRKYITALYLDEKRYDIAQDAKNFLCSRDIDFLSSNKPKVAELFFRILISFQLAYDENAAEIQKETIILFKHIALINTAAETQSMDGNLITIWFLNELYRKKEVDINSEIMKNNLKSIISGFSGISYVFKIEEDGKKVFPISNLIAKVIQNYDFKSMESITPYHVKIFQLAVELFEDQEKQEVLDKLREDCNLEFIDYLDGNQKIIDTNDFMNYKKNGVMIFYHSQKKSFLIRHTDKSYFTITDRSTPLEIKTNY